MSAKNPNPNRLKHWYLFCNCLCVIWLVNFLAFAVGALYLGGDAVNGKTEAGRYYLYGYVYHLGEKDYIEVSQDIFTYSKWHTYSLIATTFVCMIAAFTANKLKGKISALESSV